MQRIITTLLLFLSISSWSQESISYTDANSKTYYAILKADWKIVISIGEQAKQSGHNFFYLNLRLGIAYYKEAKYFKAKKSLREAYTQNSSDTTVLYYNYWNSIAVGENTLAEFYAKNIATEKKKLKSVSVIGGIKKYNISEMGSNQYHINIGSNLQFTSRLNTSVFLSRISQDIIWGDYYQHQASVRNVYQLSPKYNLEFNYNLMKIGGNVNFSNNENTITQSGTLSQLSNTIYLGTGINFNRTIVSTGFLYHNVYTNNDISIINNNSSATFNITEPVSTYHLQPNLGVQHYFKQHKSGIWLSSEMSIPITGDSLGFSWSNTVKFKTSKKSWFGLNHHFNTKINAIESNGLTVQNGDYLSSRIGASWDYAFKAKTNFNLQVMRENKTEYFENIDYNYNSIFGTLTFKF